MDEFEPVRKLIALKRYESPGEAYFERFVDDFHHRQRAEMLRLPAHRLFFDRLDAWLSGWHGRRWVGGGLAAAACAALALAFVIRGPVEDAAAPFQGKIAAEDAAPASLLREF